MGTRKQPLENFKHSGEGKKEFVQKMFDDISPHYDILNRVLSFGIDKYWRNKLIQSMNIINDQSILDVATGTGDVIFAINKKYNVESYPTIIIENNGELYEQQ